MMRYEDLRTRHLLHGKDLHDKLRKIIDGTHLKIENGEQKYEDLMSHWILCLAFSKSEELQRRLLQFELELFRYRFEQLSKLERRAFLVDEELGYVELTESEKEEMLVDFGGEKSNPLEDVYDIQRPPKSSKEYKDFNFAKTSFYKVKFTEVATLVRSRRVFVRKGIAYVADKDLISALASLFETEIMQKLKTAGRSLPSASRDERVGPLLQSFQTASLGNDMSNVSVSSKSGTVRLEDVPALAKRSFPMCARNLELALTREHHLKHLARLQYTLFLKGIGLTLEDSIAYFQREFAKKPTSPEEFRKKGYLYSIKHSFGQEGKRANYAPWSCSKALSNRQTATDHRHGCPFQEFTADKISLAVKETGVPENLLRQIVDRVKNHEYQLACRMHWEALHPKGNSDGVGNHPNAWFDESMKYHEQQDKDAKAAAEGAQGSQSGSQMQAPVEQLSQVQETQ